ncbi:snaclec echicetin subunit beta-like [Haliotis rubra]|uniref:snaclec echicetin subunit beta-like n=1 Tax=Haliotis rubra TaxID=36100 RepID=UPI001EE5997C|nr:snaclec echicetin subunit beta-like [Haliotis rubra]
MMFTGLQIVLALQGYFKSSLPQGLVVKSRNECITKCYINATCSSAFYQTSSKTCYLSDAVYTKDDLQVSADMQYLVWKRDGCGNGYSWNRTLDLCYKVHTDSHKSWTDAENACIQDGGHLLKVDNPETNLLMNHFALKKNAHLWIGGTDIQEEGRWLWADNSSIQRFWWDTNQSQYEVMQGCLLIYNDASHPLNKWRLYLGY